MERLGERGAHAFFCEDIRQEVSGQFSLIGVYGDAVYVPQFPHVFPSLAVCVSAWTPIDQMFEKLQLRLMYRGETLLSSDIEPPPFDSDTDKETRRVLRANLTITPFIATEPGNLVVRLYADDEQFELRAGGVEIKLASDAIASAASSPPAPAPA